MFRSLVLVLFFKFEFTLGSSIANTIGDVKIIGGKVTSITEVPYQVSIRDSYGNHFCGGAVIDQFNVLTAAHCCDHHKSEKLHCVLNSDTIYGGTEYPVHNATVHPDYIPATVENDIAIIHLGRRMDLENKTARAIPLSGATPSVNTSCLISGWGSVTQPIKPEFAVASIYLESARVPIFPLKECAKNYFTILEVTLNEHGILCAGYEDGKSDSCQGDSGGPLVCNGNLSGIVSWGFGCGMPELPGIYTDVSKYRVWILNNLSTSGAMKFYNTNNLFTLSLISTIMTIFQR